MASDDQIQTVIGKLVRELARATENHGPIASKHEGYSLILEELDEAWDEIKLRETDRTALTNKLIQVAAMALRTILDVCMNDEKP